MKNLVSAPAKISVCNAITSKLRQPPKLYGASPKIIVWGDTNSFLSS